MDAFGIFLVFVGLFFLFPLLLAFSLLGSKIVEKIGEVDEESGCGLVLFLFLVVAGLIAAALVLGGK